MFDRLFTRPTARARHRDGPLAQERLAYVTYLADHEASLQTLRRAARSLLTVTKYLHLAERLNNRARLCSCGFRRNAQHSAIAFAQIVAHFTHEFPHGGTMVIARHVRM